MIPVCADSLFGSSQKTLIMCIIGMLLTCLIHSYHFTEKSDSYRKLTKDKRVTHGGSLTFDMNTMTDDLPASSSEVCT